MEDLVSLEEAATYLGVSKATLRNWDRSGKLTAKRHPLNGYRLYTLDDLRSLKAEGAPTSTVQEALAPKVGMKQLRQTFSKLHNILRDGDAGSNIVTRFDEISRVLDLVFKTPASALYPQPMEDDREYASRIRDLYNESHSTDVSANSKSFGALTSDDQTLIALIKTTLQANLKDVDLDIRGVAYERLIENTFDKTDNQQFFTPHQVVDLMVAMAAPYIDGLICDPACGTGGFLRAAAKNHPTITTLGFEIDPRLAWVANLNLEFSGSDRRSVHLLNQGGSLGAAAQPYFNSCDMILTNPPFGSDYSDPEILEKFILGRGRKSRRRGILFLEQSYNFLKDDGFAVIVVDDGILNSGINYDVREFLLGHFSVRAVVSLPIAAFQPYANVNTSFLILQKGRHDFNDEIFFAKAEKIGRKPNGDDDLLYPASGHPTPISDAPNILEQWKRHLSGFKVESELCFTVHLDPAGKDWGTSKRRLDFAFNHPSRANTLKKLEELNDKAVALTDILQERSESYLPAADGTATTILFTGLKQIQPFTGMASQVEVPAQSVKSTVKRYEKGDIVFSKMRPELRKVAVVNFEDGGYVSSECMVFSPKPIFPDGSTIPSEVIASILRSDLVYGQLMGAVTGIGRPRVSPKSIRQVKIPLPTAEQTIRALDALSNAQHTADVLRSQAEALLNEVELLDRSTPNSLVRIVSGDESE